MGFLQEILSMLLIFLSLPKGLRRGEEDFLSPPHVVKEQVSSTQDRLVCCL
jgi:hypothetical protein